MSRRLAEGRGLRVRRCARALVIAATCGCAHLAEAGSFEFVVNAANNHDYGRQLIIPGGFGSGEFTFELWLRPSESLPVGPIDDDTLQQLVYWAEEDHEPYSSSTWWFRGNFLLDGHNNVSFLDGTFSLQFYGGGRLRWSFGDGVYAGPGGHWSVQAYPASAAPTLLDGRWHHVACVRRWDDGSGARLELWIDGTLVAEEMTPARTNMFAAYWNTWGGFPGGQEGWFYGAEKQAAIGVIPQYEDYKGLIDEVRFWNRAKTVEELQYEWSNAVDPFAPGLGGLYQFDENGGGATCNPVMESWDCILFHRTHPDQWSEENAPFGTVTIPEYVYVDFGRIEAGDGSQSSPFNTLSAAVAVANPGATIEIAPSGSAETMAIDKPLRLVRGATGSGSARIGVAADQGARVGKSMEGFVAPQSR